MNKISKISLLASLAAVSLAKNPNKKTGTNESLGSKIKSPCYDKVYHSSKNKQWDKKMFINFKPTSIVKRKL